MLKDPAVFVFPACVPRNTLHEPVVRALPDLYPPVKLAQPLALVPCGPEQAPIEIFFVPVQFPPPAPLPM